MSILLINYCWCKKLRFLYHSHSSFFYSFLRDNCNGDVIYAVYLVLSMTPCMLWFSNVLCWLEHVSTDFSPVRDDLRSFRICCPLNGAWTIESNSWTGFGVGWNPSSTTFLNNIGDDIEEKKPKSDQGEDQARPWPKA